MIRNPQTIRQIADLIGAEIEGDEAITITGIAAIDSAGPQELTFASDEKRAAQLGEGNAAAAIVHRSAKVSSAQTLLRVDDVSAAIAKLLEAFAPSDDLPPVGVHASAAIDPAATIGRNAAIGPGAVVGPRAKLGDGCVLCANAFVGADVELGDDVILYESAVIRYGCKLGSRVRIGPNSVIGYDGFGYLPTPGGVKRFRHAGDVVIEDDVEIDACTCVDRAKFGSTVIGAATKIDNLVQIAHNVRVGAGSMFAAHVGVAGSTRIGKGVVFGGHVGIRDNITIGDGVQCAAFSAIAADAAPGMSMFGIPAIEGREMLRVAICWRKLPELLHRVAKLEKRLKELGSSEDH